MSDTLASLRRKVDSAAELQSVVRAMKALAASSMGQYEQSVRALADYFRTVELGLGVCFRSLGTPPPAISVSGSAAAVSGGVVVFGSDQGLVGQFNDVIAEHAASMLSTLPGTPQVWAVGERVHARLLDAGLAPAGMFEVPGSVEAITPLVWRILMATGRTAVSDRPGELHLCHNRPLTGSVYAPVSQRLLPLDAAWCRDLEARPWPTHNLPEPLGHLATTLRALVHEYLFVSIFRACAESLASENASRLAAMQRADRNIETLLGELSGRFHRLRQADIDAELFDVVSGFEALGGTPQ